MKLLVSDANVLFDLEIGGLLEHLFEQPIIAKIKAWLAKQNPPPKSLLSKAIGYMRGEWQRLTVFLEDGRLPLDNNGAEHVIRHLAIGRKRWLSCDRVACAESSAALCGLAETAQLNGVNVYCSSGGSSCSCRLRPTTPTSKPCCRRTSVARTSTGCSRSLWVAPTYLPVPASGRRCSSIKHDTHTASGPVA